MSWARLDDRWRGNEKHLRAQHLAGTKLVKWLWVEALSECCDNRTDGVIAAFRFDLVYEGTGLPKSKRDRFRDALVSSRLWHDDETVARCTPCCDALKQAGRTLEPGDVRIHDFEEYQDRKADQATPIDKMRANRKRALLRDVELLEQIYLRDQGLCRYCGVRCTEIPNDNRSRTRLQHDHLDPGCFEPNLGNTLAGVVHACAGCNRKKGERTPDEAGMELLKPGTTARDLALAVQAAAPHDALPSPSAPTRETKAPAARVEDLGALNDDELIELASAGDTTAIALLDERTAPSEPGTERTDRAIRREGDGSGRHRVGTGSDRERSTGSGSGQRRSRDGPGAPRPREARPP